MYKRLQEYNTSLQQYNSKLQTELNLTSETLNKVEREKAALMENLSNLRGYHESQQDQLVSTKVSLEESLKLKDALAGEVGSLRGDLHQVREDRDRQLSLVEDLTSEVVQYKECTGKSAAELSYLTSRSTELEEELAIAEKQLEVSFGFGRIKSYQGEALRKKMHNTILELKGNIRVFCRVRPLLLDDGVENEAKTISFPTTTEAIGRGIEVMQHGQCHPFMFDKVFTPQSSQEEVFVEISQLVQSALDGYKVCIFAYGQTGSGKTHTMMGTPGSYDDKGLIPRSLEQIFEARQKLKEQGWKYEMQVSMLEIYNETIRDLLSSNKSSVADSGSNKQQYAIKHDSNGNTHVSDLTIVDVRSSKEVSFLLNRAGQSRSVGKTQMNEQSSRSHFVFTLRISGVNENMEQHVHGVLNLIDLAGSERLSKSGSTGDRLKETQAINKSLSSLSDVIFALGKKEEHIPFRNSKLTYLLQPCLGGDSKTLMVVNVSPEPSSVNESLCSLRFAARVNACEISIPRRQTSMRYLEPRLSYG
ncbi:putative minus-end-directed kinesin ATPase [Helianthus annuus]|nr:putative minus-end-directed kinesin ATPase [Helianthus annuus]